MKIIKKEDIPSRCKLSSGEIIELTKNKYKHDWFKPSGFWYGIKHYWLDFFTNDFERKGSSKFKFDGCLYQIKIKSELFTTIDNPDINKILLIKTIKEIRELENKYSIADKVTKRLDKLIGFTNKYIDWKQVAKEFGGIEIKYNPWSKGIIISNNSTKKYLPFWYSAWDVPSGVIWSWNILSNIKIKLIK